MRASGPRREIGARNGYGVVRGEGALGACTEPGREIEVGRAARLCAGRGNRPVRTGREREIGVKSGSGVA